MGVYYPPHLLLYRPDSGRSRRPTSQAWSCTRSGAGWGRSGRRGGSGSRARVGAGGFSWATSGFFVIHLPHQWGYTAGSWMPWAWGLAWLLVRRRRAVALYAVPAGPGLVLQVFPGHFQLAFWTEVGARLDGPLAIAGRWIGDLRRRGAGRRRRRGARSGAAAGRRGDRWRWPRSSRWRRCSSGRRPAGRAGRRPARLRVSLGLRRDAGPPGQLRGAGAVPRSPALAAVASGTRSTPRPRSIWPTSAWSRCSWPSGVVREFRRDAGRPAAAVLALVNPDPQPRALRPWVPAPDPAARLLVLPGPGALEPGDRAGAGCWPGKGFDRWPDWPRPGRSLRRFAVVAACSGSSPVVAA